MYAKLRQVVILLFLIGGCILIQPVEVEAVTDTLLPDTIPLPQELDSSLPDLKVEEPHTDIVHEIIEPAADNVEEAIDTVQTVIEEAAEPIEQAEPIMEAVNAVVRQPVLVDEIVVVPIVDRIGDGVQVIPVVNELDAMPILDPILDRLTTVKPHHDDSENKSDPPSIRKQQPNKPAVIVIHYGYSISTGSSGSDYSGGSASNLIAGTRDGEYMLTRIIIVTRNYANEFILYDQWSHAPPGQPPKPFLLNLIMDYKS